MAKVDDVEKQIEDVSPPEVELVFDAACADVWLHEGNQRVRNVYDSIRFDPQGMPTEHMALLLRLAAMAIKGEYTVGFDKVPARGVLYVPDKLSRHAVLDDMERGEVVVGYRAVRRAKE